VAGGGVVPTSTPVLSGAGKLVFLSSEKSRKGAEFGSCNLSKCCACAFSTFTLGELAITIDWVPLESFVLLGRDLGIDIDKEG
jgi:hypothetical protein